MIELNMAMSHSLDSSIELKPDPHTSKCVGLDEAENGRCEKE